MAFLRDKINYLLSFTEYLTPAMSGSAYNWDKLAPTGTNLGLFKNMFLFNLAWRLKKSQLCPTWVNWSTLWNQTQHPCFISYTLLLSHKSYMKNNNKSCHHTLHTHITKHNMPSTHEIQHNLHTTKYNTHNNFSTMDGRLELN